MVDEQHPDRGGDTSRTEAAVALSGVCSLTLAVAVLAEDFAIVPPVLAAYFGARYILDRS